MGDTWYYVDDTTNSQQGPCTVPELGRLLAGSSISDNTLVWRDGQPGWEALSAVSSLHAQVRAASAPAPPVPGGKSLPPLPPKPRAGGGGRGGGGGGAFEAAQASAPVVQSMSGERNRDTEKMMGFLALFIVCSACHSLRVKPPCSGSTPTT